MRLDREKTCYIQRSSLGSGVAGGLSLSPANRFRTTLARFLLLPPLGGLARIFGANESRRAQLSRLLESVEILVRMSQNAVAHCARAALKPCYDDDDYYYYYYYYYYYFFFFFTPLSTKPEA